MALPPAKIPSEVKDIAEAIATGQVKNAKMEWNEDGSVSFSADSPDGSARITMQKHEFAGVTQESKTDISKPANKAERLQRVEILKKQGKTQTEIAHFTMTSQKTVSNDIKELRAKGLIE
ncbi:TPA: winged helix-turn-helix transcriptional regulator [Vibrio harveyi]|nr:winged helix-turn-helix transcriptional regulator [Vibrio parahaemolyticus]HDM8215243.1 winged helix-turn-helix transcriptional regulator [Vibrio harveyi]